MGILDRFRFGNQAPPQSSASPFKEQGFGGTAIYGGAIQSPNREDRLADHNRWEKAQHLLTDISIISAGLRYYLNLVARPSWKVEPADDSGPAQEAADFVDSIIHGTDASWSRTIRRQAIYPFHGFGLHEWVAKKRPDGRIGIASINVRPVHTIDRWQMDENLSPIGVWQRSPMGGDAIY